LVDLVANAEFTDFLANELVTWVRTHYNVTKDPGKVVVGGQSAGGLAAPYVALRHPDVFGNSISLSGAFWWSPEHSGGVCGAKCPETRGLGGDDFVDSTTEGNWMAKQFLASPKQKIRFYLTAGAFERDREGTGGGILETSRQLRDILRAQGYDVKFEQFIGGHDGISWRGSFGSGLIAMLGGIQAGQVKK
jgi:enterochelin esterase family protein